MSLWLLARSWNILPYLYPEGQEPRLAGADSYFHLRHSEEVLNNFPHLKRVDHMTSFPKGERGINQGFYDILVAGISKASLGILSPLQILTWAAALCTGVAGLMVGFWLMRREKVSTGLIFFLLILAFPGALIQVCSVGNGDHHGFEVILATSLALGLCKALQAKSSPLWTLCPAFLLYLFFLSWPGAPLHLFFSGLCFFTVAFLPHPKEARRSLILKGVLFGLVTALLPWLTGFMSPNLVAWKIVQDVFLGAGLALALGYPLLVPLAQALSGRKRAALALLILLLVPLLAQLNETAASSLNTFFAPRESSISEHSRVSARLLFAYYGVTWLALFTTPILLLREKKISKCAIPLIYGLGLVFFWMYTRDFHYYAPLVIAATAAYSLGRLPWRNWTPALIVLIASVSVLPLPQQQRPWLTQNQAHSSMIHTNGLSQAAQWLSQIREQTPEEREYGLLAPWDLGNLLAHISKTPVGWSQTHSVELAQYLYTKAPETVYEELVKKRRKPFRFILIPSRNLEDKLGTEFTLAGGEVGEILELGPELERKGQKFRVPKPGAKFQRVTSVQLFDGLGSNLGNFRMVYESPQQVVRALRIREDLHKGEFNALEVTPQEAEALTPVLRLKNQVVETSRGPLVNPFLSPDVRIFEMVPGAVLTGKTKKHGRVGAILSLSAPYDNLPKLVTWRVYADAEGNFQLRLPYPTNKAMYDVPGTIRVNGKYKVEVDGKQMDLEITEEQVQSGAEVPWTAPVSP